MESNLYTIKEVAKKLGWSTKTVYRHIKTGRLPAVLLGDRDLRIKPEALETFVRGLPSAVRG